jgi:hypothetical protein
MRRKIVDPAVLSELTEILIEGLELYLESNRPMREPSASPIAGGKRPSADRAGQLVDCPARP